jgi:chlorophyll(ide) b reductase
MKKFNVIVTGGTRGLGRSIVREFASKGHSVVYTTRQKTTDKTVSDFADSDFDSVMGKALAVRCDVSQASDVKALFASAARFHGTMPDAIIVNAATSGGYGALLDAQDTSLKETINTNLLGSMLCCKYFLKSTNAGDIIFIIGTGSDGSATPNFAAYGSTKAAVMQLSRSMRKEIKASESFGDTRIHTLSPGMMPTPLLLENLPARVESCVRLFCAHPDDVAKWSVDNINRILTSRHRHEHLQFFSPMRAAKTLLVNCSKLVGEN